MSDFQEQRPGEQMPGAVGFRDKPLFNNAIPPKWPCSKCHHPFAEHKFMYGVGTSDKYKCEHAGCECGKQYQAVAMMVRPDQIDTDAKRQEFAKRMAEAQRIEFEKFE